MSTIVAISTATGKGGIGIIRMSGENCFEILDKIFIPKTKSDIKGYSIKYGNIINSETNEVIDEVLVSYFVKPRSYTTENMCEINSHGGFVVENAILEECLKNGASLAEPGEFTKRAFLNGRIDLSQAEAVVDMINSKTEKEMKASVNQLEGRLSRKIREIQEMLLDAMADIEASIDYPEYDIEETTNVKLRKIFNDTETKLLKLKDSYNNSKIIKEGIKTIIVGKPNVGKSSLLNLMLNEERAIVSNIEGTTRDTIEEFININGIPLKIIDTAGRRNASDEVEKIGVEKTIKVINDADLIIALFDDSRAFDNEDEKILNLIENKKTIVLLNKVDLEKEQIDYEKKFGNKKVIRFSTKTETGLDELYDTISDMFRFDEIEINDGEIITNIRQKEHIENSLKALKEGKKELENSVPIDISAIYLKNVLEELGYITGQNVSEDIINEIFAKFCLGK